MYYDTVPCGPGHTFYFYCHSFLITQIQGTCANATSRIDPVVIPFLTDVVREIQLELI
jgi:hypothetical protein